jgi:DNA polymerase III delta subunit
MTPSPVALFRGDDAYAIDRAVERLAVTLGDPGPPLQRWRIEVGDERTGLDRLLDRISEHVGTAPLFGGGELVVVSGVAPLARDRTPRERLIALVGDVPPGNGLALLDLREPSSRRGAAADPLGDAVTAAGGTVASFPAMTRERMTAWLTERAAELGVRLGPGAGQALTERIGAQVREGDIDRRHQGAIANNELEKLALYRPSGTITRDDVVALVPEAVPGSAWALLDAVGGRQAGAAATLAERLLSEGTPLQVLVARLHGRLRELVVAADHLASGTRPGDLVRAMRLQPFRAQRLAEQAAAWTTVELDAALEGLLGVDLASKGIGADGGPAPTSDERGRLALDLWLAERVARRADRRPAAAGRSVGA